MTWSLTCGECVVVVVVVVVCVCNCDAELLRKEPADMDVATGDMLLLVVYNDDLTAVYTIGGCWAWDVGRGGGGGALVGGRFWGAARVVPVHRILIRIDFKRS